jgi:hypothetical protein
MRLPEILPDELFETTKVAHSESEVPQARPPPFHPAFPAAPLKPTVLAFDLASADPFADENDHREGSPMKSSMSTGDFMGFDFESGESSLFQFKKPNMKRSESHQLGLGSQWSLFDDDPPYFF